MEPLLIQHILHFSWDNYRLSGTGMVSACSFFFHHTLASFQLHGLLYHEGSTFYGAFFFFPNVHSCLCCHVKSYCCYFIFLARHALQHGTTVYITMCNGA